MPPPPKPAEVSTTTSTQHVINSTSKNTSSNSTFNPDVSDIQKSTYPYIDGKDINLEKYVIFFKLLLTF